MTYVNSMKEVDFHKYCQLCEHFEENENDPNSPCYDCLAEPTNLYSKQPVYFKEKEKGNGK